MRFVLVLLTALLFQQCALFVPPPPPKPQHQYIPEKFHNLHLGMTYAQFYKVKGFEKMPTLTKHAPTFKIVEKIDGEQIKNVAYHFKAKGEEPFYKMIIEYNDAETMRSYVNSQYGHPNNDSEWSFDSKEGFQMAIAATGNKLIIEALLPIE